jgi:hypothetical protein
VPVLDPLKDAEKTHFASLKGATELGRIVTKAKINRSKAHVLREFTE